MVIDSRPRENSLCDLDLPLGRRYLVGVSGGCDSVVLLHLLHQQGHRDLVVCHLDHGLRGDASDGDARFVEAFAGRLGFPFEVEKAEVASLAQSSGNSIELEARRARHGFFARVALRHQCNRVVLAHHADDQAETVLMNVLRGTGLRGLAGMAASSEMEVDGEVLVLLRPLLGVSRAELESFASESGIEYREDASNRSREHLRNRVRLDLLPLASEVMGRDVRGSLARLARNARGDSELLEQMVGDALENCRHPDETADLSVGAIVDLPEALRSRVVMRWLAAHDIGDLSEDLAKRVMALLHADDAGSPAKCNLPGGHWVRRRSGRLFVERCS